MIKMIKFQEFFMFVAKMMPNNAVKPQHWDIQQCSLLQFEPNPLFFKLQSQR